MNTLNIISKKVLECSLSDKLEILISMRAFILEIYECPWALIDHKNNLNDQILDLQNKSLQHYKNINERNIKKLHINPIEILILPKNKKNKLLKLVDSLIENNINEKEILFDKLRSDPFAEDNLLKFILDHSENININILSNYQLRNHEAKELLSKANIHFHYYHSCFVISRMNKIKDYWINIWGIEEKYRKISFIDYIILK